MEPNRDEVLSYWRNIWETPVQNKQSSWVQEEKKTIEGIKTMYNKEMKIDEV